MPAPIAFDRPADPLYYGVPLRHALDLPLLGVPVHCLSNSPDALAAIADAFGRWRALEAHPELIAPDGVRFVLVVHDGDEGGGEPVRVTCRMPHPDLLLFHTPGSIGVVDIARREAVAYCTAALLADPAQARGGALSGMILTLATARDRVPVHAAMIARGSAALLLAAPPGTGKSTLAHHAAVRGLRVLSDDAAYIQTAPELRVWGIPGRVLLLDGPGGAKRAVELADAWPAPGAPPPVARQVGVCLLERNGGSARLSRASHAEVCAFLTADLGVNGLRHGAALPAALDRLGPEGGGGWRLALSEDPADALPLIEEMLDEVEARR